LKHGCTIKIDFYDAPADRNLWFLRLEPDERRAQGNAITTIFSGFRLVERVVALMILFLNQHWNRPKNEEQKYGYKHECKQ
jgi:hypothetical protein